MMMPFRGSPEHGDAVTMTIHSDSSTQHSSLMEWSTVVLMRDALGIIHSFPVATLL